MAAPALYTQTLGSGPDLVFLHGWGMHAGIWNDIIEFLVDQYRVTLIDLPGHGYSRAGSAQTGFAAAEPGVGHQTRITLRDLSHIVANNAPRQAVWIGWSLGGLIAQRLAIDRPERVTKLVLVSSSPCFVRRPDWPHAMEGQVLRQFAHSLAHDYRATLKRFIALEVHGAEQEIAQLRALRALVFQRGEPDPDILHAGLSLLEDEDLRAELKFIQCPTLLLMGRRDTLVPTAAARATQRLLPDARLHLIEGAAHAPFFSHLQEFVLPLQGFLHE